MISPQPKPEPRRRVKRRKQRQAAKVVKSVRAQVVERDGECRVFHALARMLLSKDRWSFQGVTPAICNGESEWAHLHSHRRSQTRGQAAEKRHTTAGSLMLCRYHHQEYDAHRLTITALTRKGADGPLKFRRA